MARAADPQKSLQLKTVHGCVPVRATLTPPIAAGSLSENDGTGNQTGGWDPVVTTVFMYSLSIPTWQWTPNQMVLCDWAILVVHDIKNTLLWVGGPTRMCASFQQTSDKTVLEFSQIYGSNASWHLKSSNALQYWKGCLFFVWLVASHPSNMVLYLRDRSARTVLRTARLRQKLQIKLSISPGHSMLTPGWPVPALTL